jgi:hypothetical protein
MLLVFDAPMTADGAGEPGRRRQGIGQGEGGFAAALPQAGLGVAGQDIAGDTDHRGDVWLPFGIGHDAGGLEYGDGSGLVAGAGLVDVRDGLDAGAGGAQGLDLLPQGGLVVFQLNDNLHLGLRGSLKGFLTVKGIGRDDVPGDVEFAQELLGSGDLVRLVIDLDRGQHESGIDGKGAENLGGFAIVEGIEAVPEGLAIQSCHPGRSGAAPVLVGRR